MSPINDDFEIGAGCEIVIKTGFRRAFYVGRRTFEVTTAENANREVASLLSQGLHVSPSSVKFESTKWAGKTTAYKRIFISRFS